jgi:hypothetical protein
MNGKENDTWFLKGIIGGAFTVELLQHRFITKDTRNGILERSQSSG